MSDELPTTNEDSNPTVDADTEPSKPKARKPPPTPFDYPFVFPITLLIAALWFGYDGFFNSEIKSVGFNRGVFGFLFIGFLLTLWLDIMDVRKQRKKRESESQASS